MNKITIKTVTLAYFSGTGGTEAIAGCFESQFLKAGVNVNIVEIACFDAWHNEEMSDLLIILSPVYAFRLASIVERWVKSLPENKNMLAAVISISAGGETSPNTACRDYCKRLLIKKGYNLVYEKMLVMPSNFAVQAKHQLNLLLINAMPRKVERIVTGILSGEVNFTRPLFIDRFFAFIGKSEHIAAKIFGLSIYASKGCNQCGLCAQKCPTKNIIIKNGRLRSHFNCIWCLKCIYNCPRNALFPRIFKFSVLKNGYNFKEMLEEAHSQCNMEYKLSPNILWQSVIDYLKKD